MRTQWNEDDFSSKNGMITSVWGSSLWHVLHTISFNYPVNPSSEDKENYYNFLKYLGKVLPCKFCRDNYSKNLDIINFNVKCLNDRNSFSKCIYNLHNAVNNDLHKSCEESYKIIKSKYENFRSRCHKDTKSLGCTEPLNGVKQKCILKIVPQSSKEKSFSISSNCKKPMKKSKRHPKKSKKMKMKMRIKSRKMKFNENLEENCKKCNYSHASWGVCDKCATKSIELYNKYKNTSNNNAKNKYLNMATTAMNRMDQLKQYNDLKNRFDKI
jgi:hypothetical protein